MRRRRRTSRERAPGAPVPPPSRDRILGARRPGLPQGPRGPPRDRRGAPDGAEPAPFAGLGRPGRRRRGERPPRPGETRGERQRRRVWVWVWAPSRGRRGRWVRVRVTPLLFRVRERQPGGGAGRRGAAERRPRWPRTRRAPQPRISGGEFGGRGAVPPREADALAAACGGGCGAGGGRRRAQAPGARRRAPRPFSPPPCPSQTQPRPSALPSQARNAPEEGTSNEEKPPSSPSPTAQRRAVPQLVSLRHLPLVGRRPRRRRRPAGAGRRAAGLSDLSPVSRSR